MIAPGSTGPFFLNGITNSRQFVTHVLTPCVDHLSDYKRTYAFFQLESVTAHTANSAEHWLETVWWQNNKQVCVAFISAGSEPLQFFYFRPMKGYTG